MNSRTTKIAVAAAILVVALAGIHYLGGAPDGTSIVLAEAARNMETISSYTCRMTSWRRPDQGDDNAAPTDESTMRLWYSNELGFRMEQHRNGEPMLTVCMLRESNEGIRVWPQRKNYVRTPVSEEDHATMDAQEQDPREWVRLFMTADYRSLGRDVIGGVTVEGVEINEMGVTRNASAQIGDYAARLWIDVESRLPVRMEEEYTLDSVPSGGTMDQFEWNPNLSTADLEPDIPADYVNLAEQSGR